MSDKKLIMQGHREALAQFQEKLAKRKTEDDILHPLFNTLVKRGAKHYRQAIRVTKLRMEIDNA